MLIAHYLGADPIRFGRLGGNERLPVTFGLAFAQKKVVDGLLGG